MLQSYYTTIFRFSKFSNVHTESVPIICRKSLGLGPTCQNAENILHEHKSGNASFLIYPRCLGKNTMPAELSVLTVSIHRQTRILTEFLRQAISNTSPLKLVPTLLVTVYWGHVYFHHTSQDQIAQISWNTTSLYFWMIFPLII